HGGHFCGASRTDRFPQAMPKALLGPRCERKDAVLSARVGAVSIDHHRGRHDEATKLCSALDHGFEKRRRAYGVDVDIPPHLDHPLAVSHHACLVVDDIDAAKGAVDGLAIT